MARKGPDFAHNATLFILAPATEPELENATQVWVVVGPKAEKGSVGTQKPRVDDIGQEAAEMSEVAETVECACPLPDRVVLGVDMLAESPTGAAEMEEINDRGKVK